MNKNNTPKIKIKTKYSIFSGYEKPPLAPNQQGLLNCIPKKKYIDKYLKKRRIIKYWKRDNVLFKQKILGVSLVTGFLFFFLFSGLFLAYVDPTNSLQNNKIYINIGIVLAVMVAISCMGMLILKNKQRKKDKQHKQHCIFMLGIFFGLVGCLLLSLTLINQAIAHYLSFEAPAFFMIETFLLAIKHATFSTSKRSKIMGVIAFLMQTIGGFALFNKAMHGSKLYLNINTTQMSIMLEFATLGVGLMILNMLFDAKEDKVILASTSFCCV